VGLAEDPSTVVRVEDEDVVSSCPDVVGGGWCGMGWPGPAAV
jgi:hypothetical protein